MPHGELVTTQNRAILGDLRCKVIPSLNRRGWDGLHWDGYEVAILASGESLSLEQCEAVKAWRTTAYATRKVIAINTTFRRALWADVLYACDGAWWDGRDRSDMPTYYDEARAKFLGELWTLDVDAAKKKTELRLIKSEIGGGLSRQPGLIRQGANGGHQALGVAYWSGARTVYLLGFDMHGGHWHGEHPAMLRKNQRFDIFLQHMGQMAADVSRETDFEVVNCTPDSAMKCFPKRDWREVFA